MALLGGFCAQGFLLVALISGTCLAGFSRFDKDRAARSKLRIQTVHKAADNSYAAGAPACTPGNPQFPNYIEPMKIDPTRMMGKWYLYLAWYDGILDTPFNVNVVITNTNILNGSLTLYPGSNTQAVAMEQLYAGYSLETNQCIPDKLTYLEYLTADGQLRGFGFRGNLSAPETSLVMGTDYETYGVFFECDKYDLNSGICADVYLYVYTRERQDKVSATTANNIANAVSQALGSYCFTVDLMKKYSWLNDMPECPLEATTYACYASLREGFLYLGDPDYVYE